MTDQTTAQDATADSSTKAQDAEEQQQDTTQSADQPTGFDALPKETQDEIRKLRRENAKARTTIKQFEDASKSDIDRLTSERDDFKGKYEALETKLRTANARTAVFEAASKADAISPRAVFALAQDALDYDDDGEPTNVSSVIAAIRKSDPDLFRAQTGSHDGGHRGDAAGSDDMNANIRRLAGRG